MAKRDFFIVQEDGRVVLGVCNCNGHHRKGAGDDKRRSYWSRLEDQAPEGLNKIPLQEDCNEVVQELYYSRIEYFNN